MFQEFEDEILQHLRQISLYGSPQQLTQFLQEVMVEFYICRQPELLCTVFDELDQERPAALQALFSPARSDDTSVAPSSSKSSVLSYISGSSQAQQRKAEQSKSFARYKSFDMSHSRQINLAAAGGRRIRRDKSKS